MIRYVFMLALAITSFVITANAQTAGAMTRSMAPPTRFQKQHMPQTEEMLINLLKDSNPTKRATAVQNIRDLEFIYPDEPFNNFLTPLTDILKDEKEPNQIRLLTAIALDELHSETGDDAIKEMSKTSSNQSVKDLCNALINTPEY